VQQGAEAFGTDRVEGRPDDLGTVRAEPRGGHAPLVERLDRLAHRLVVAAQVARDRRGSLTPRARQDAWAATQRKGIG